MEFKIQKFLVIPILSTFGDDGILFREDRLKHFVVYLGRTTDLKIIAKRIQEKVNEEKGKAEKTKDGRRSRTTKISKDLASGGYVSVSSNSRKGRPDNSIRNNKTHSRVRSIHK